MKILGKGLTRRGLLKRLGLAAVLLPVVPLGKTIAEAEQRRRRKSDPDDLDTVWIGHC